MCWEVRPKQKDTTQKPQSKAQDRPAPVPAKKQERKPEPVVAEEREPAEVAA